LRYSISELIQVIDANLEGQAASTGNVVNIIPNGNRFRVLNTSLDVGVPAPGFAHPQYLNADSTFKTAAEIEAVLSSYTEFGGFNSNLPTITHCGSGLSCTPIFFALDAILGLDIAVWDGSTGQWADYGELNIANSNDYIDGDITKPAWTTPAAWDVNAIVAGQSRSLTAQTRSDSDPALDTALINQFLRIQDISDPAFNQIEEEDKGYIEGGAQDGAPEAGADVVSGC
jgi:hypothetical protein